MSSLAGNSSMANKLETPNVFLDTDVFLSRNFSCNDATMTKVVELASKEKIHVYLTGVTVDQIKAQIRKFVEAIPVAEQLEKEFGPSWNRAELTTAFKRLSRGEIVAEVLEGFDAFCDGARIAIISTSVERYCSAQNMDAYVIGRNKGCREACEGPAKLFHLERLEEFVDLVSREDALSG